MTIIDEQTVVVTTSDELKEVLENTNTYNYIYFGANISLSKGIKISSTKTKVTIDGTYENYTYTFEDNKSLSASNTINISSPLISQVTVCNMNIIGNNYYGIIYVPESNTYKDTIVEYNNITYEGPQISFNPNGLTRFIDSTITIKDTTLTTGGEVAECNKIEIGGNTTINHLSKGNSSFWFRNTSPTLTILEQASVNFTSENRELFYGTNELTFNILLNATFNVTSKNGLAYQSFGTKNTTIYSNATFTLKQTAANGNYPTWYSYGLITLENNASLIIINDFSNINVNNYNIFFSSTNSGLILNNPKKVLLYNTTANIIYSNSTSTFTFLFTRLNLFDKALTISDNISLENIPTYSWYKTALSSITGTFTSSKTTITTNNYTEDELKILPALTNFSFQNKKALSIGTTLLNINPLSDVDTLIIGYTEPNSSVLINYENMSAIAISDETGKFLHILDLPLAIGTELTFTVKKYNDLIYTTKKITIVYPGEINITNYPATISFELIPISKNPLICPKSEDLSLTILDSRINKTTWSLYATITNDLETESNNILTNSLIFKDINNTIHTLSETKTLIYTETENLQETTVITMNKNEGILLQINNPIIENSIYKSRIIWTIE